MKVSLIGAGNIGSQFYRHATQMGWKVPIVVEADGVYDSSDASFDGRLWDFLKNNPKRMLCAREDFLEKVRETDAAAIAIPTFDNGEEALGLIKQITKLGIPVVTSEKGALSYRFGELENLMDSGMLGFSASVGGGTRMLSFLNSMSLEGGVSEIHAIVNATINNIISKCETVNLDEAIRNSIEIGIAEPGSTSTLDLINTEVVKDIPRKATIIFNLLMKNLGIRDYISFGDIKTQPISDKMLQNVIERANKSRYIVSLVKKEYNEDNDILGGFRLFKNGWEIKGGFMDLEDNKMFKKIWVSDENNAMMVSKGNKGIYTITGPGARPGPTVDAMIFDVLQFTKNGLIKP